MKQHISKIKLHVWVISILLAHILWKLIRAIYGACQLALWNINGTSTQIKKHYDKSVYEGSLQVLKVLGRYKFAPTGQRSDKGNFIASHERFADPEYVLMDHVSLFYINKSEAIWVEVVKGVDPTKCEYSGFFYFAQWKLAKKLIIMPIHVFHKLGNKLGKPKTKIIILSNTSRCGSTLMTKIFAETKMCQAFSEPDCINAITQLRNVVSDEERDRIFTSCINLLCKPLNSEKIETYFIKLAPATMAEIPHIKRLFPDSYHLFLYRDVLAVATSFARLTSVTPIDVVIKTLGKWSSIFTKRGFLEMGVLAEQYKVKLENEFHFGIVIRSAAVRHYLDLRQQGFPIQAAQYEDIKKNPNAAFQNIFKYCDLPFDAEAVENGMSVDSQHSTPLSMVNLKHGRAGKLTDEKKCALDKISDQFKVPRLRENYIAPGTTTS